MSGNVETTDCDKLLETISVLEEENAKLQNKIAALQTGSQANQQDNDLLQRFEKISEEFRDFAYIVSHDLKAPLRGIKTLACWITDDYSDKLDNEGKEQLELLSSRVNRMESLIEGILQYSRIGRVAEEVVAVDIKEIVDEIVELNIPDESISVAIETDLPTIEGEKTRITELFKYLIDNAVKFMGSQPEPRIEIGVRLQAKQTICYVRDNGVGIEPGHHDKIFGLFDRLDEETEGTGIGLALVKRIIEVHGGRIWVESKGRGQGSAFCFTLPQPEEALNGEM